MKPHVLYVGPFALRTGYAQAAHDYMLALHRAGVSMEIQPIVECNTDDLEERYDELLPLVRGYGDHTRAEKPTHVIVHTVPAHAHRFLEIAPPGAMRIAITTWETHLLPDEIANALERFDVIAVPSEFCAAAMATLGNKLRVVPHCFDSEHWPLVDVAPRSPYVFYSALGWAERKNPIGLLKAYYASFTADDDVVLRLKVSGYSPADVEALKAATGLDDLPRVEIVTDYLDHEAMAGFHHAGHCFVTAARGEGWNLPLFEATILGNPTISTWFGGQADYLSPLEYPHLEVPYQLTPAITPPVIQPFASGVSIAKQTAPSGITARQRWAEPDLHVLGNLMRQAYEQRWVRREKFDRFRLDERYGYATVAAQLIDLLKEDPRDRRTQ